MIFILDDDDAVRDSLRVLLESAGLEVRDFASGLQFLAEAWPVSTDCLLLDINMPEVDGLEVLRRLRERHAELPVIIITGRPDALENRQSLKAEVFAVLEKPFRDDELIETVVKALAMIGPAPQPR